MAILSFTSRPPLSLLAKWNIIKASGFGVFSTPCLIITSAPPPISSAGSNIKWILQLSISFVLAQSFARTRATAMFASCPQACIAPFSFDAKERFVFSSIGTASISARTTIYGRLLSFSKRAVQPVGSMLFTSYPMFSR